MRLRDGGKVAAVSLAPAEDAEPETSDSVNADSAAQEPDTVQNTEETVSENMYSATDTDVIEETEERDDPDEI